MKSNLNLSEKIRAAIPEGMSTTEAAKRLGVSRPTLSKLLNGRAALSLEMAFRFKKTFGVDMTELLEFQVNAESETKKKEHRGVSVNPYVPSFLAIKAGQIEDWGTKSIDARNQLPVLVRRLVQATGRDLQQVDFPGFDNAQRRGFDGRVLADGTALNVPMGRSVWELSVQKDVQRKANSDYIAGLEKLSQDQQTGYTFIFVTTRNWRDKDKWVSEKNALDNWKEVRAYDASDLEQWLETTVEPRIWLAEKLQIPTEGFQTVEACWNEWASATEPQMTSQIFAPSVDEHKREFQRWLESSPDRPFIVVADSHQEGVAFVACLLREVDCISTSLGNAVVFDSVDILKSLAGSISPFIVVVGNEEVEQSIAVLYRHRHCIVIRPRNAPVTESHITINQLGMDAFEKALNNMGIIDLGRIKMLVRESGLSPIVLRRRLSRVPSIQIPPWARERKMARKLIPMALVGAWHAGRKADREILTFLSDNTKDEDYVESVITELRQLSDSPIWSIGNHHGVVSKIDTIFALITHIRKRDIENFIEIAEYVLSEIDPALDLPDDKRWLATLYDKLREHSDVLRSGIRDTLIFLAVHGNSFLGDNLGIDLASKVSDLIERLLTPLTYNKMESFNYDLPDFAEGAPHIFLDILQEDLEKSESVLRLMLQSVEGGIFTISPRTGLLWALERLAWHREYIMDVVSILAKLSHVQTDDNWANTPVRSLESILHPRVPQTSVPMEERILVLQKLCKDFPDVAWQICIHQINGQNLIPPDDIRPRWRTLPAGTTNPVRHSEQREFEQATFDLVVNWSNYSTKMMGELAPLLSAMGEDKQSKVLDCFDKWMQTDFKGYEVVEIRDQIGRLVYGAYAPPSSLCPETIARLRGIFQRLIPKDSFKRLALPFRDCWTYFPVIKVEDSNLDKSEWPARYDTICRQAMREIISSYGFDGVMKLLREDNSASMVGRFTAFHADHPKVVMEIVRACLSTDISSHEKINNFLKGFFEELRDGVSVEMLSSVGSDGNFLRVIRCMPFTVQTWNLIDELLGIPDNIRRQYWKNVHIPLREYSEDEARKLVDNLLRVDRPWDAFFALRTDWDRVETSVLVRLLQGVTNIGLTRVNYSGDVAYYMPKALMSLSKRSDVSVDEIAQLEFASIEWILPNECKVPYLEKQIEESPIKFIYFLYLFKEHSVQDPEGWYIKDEDLREVVRWRALRLFEVLRRLPGQNNQGEIEVDVLNRWVCEARHLALGHGCIENFDLNLGQWLARASSREDIPWPKRPICEVMENIGSKEIGAGFLMGVFNSRETTVRRSYEGGGQEWELAATYQQRAKVWMIEFPFVSKVIQGIAASYEGEAVQEDHDAQLRQRSDL